MNKNTEAYRLLEMQGIESLIATPLMKKGQIVGFIGVDDPKQIMHDISLLRSCADIMITVCCSRSSS